MDQGVSVFHQQLVYFHEPILNDCDPMIQPILYQKIMAAGRIAIA
jgi:hypothetical protein